MVYLVYSSSEFFEGVYEDESEAKMICNSKNIDSEHSWEVTDLAYYKKELPTFEYSEEDSEYDEAYYLDKISSLKEHLNQEKKRFRNLEDFTNFFIMLLFISIIYSCVILLLVI